MNLEAIRVALGLVLACGTLVTWAQSTTTYTYLDDADTTAPPSGPPSAPPVQDLPFPRINYTESGISIDVEQLSKYHLVSAPGGKISKAQDLREAYPEVVILRYVIPLQPAGDVDFDSTGASTANGSVFAGHWLYEAGSTTTQSLSSSATTVTVADVSRFDVGDYVVIYNAGSNFSNAEHAQITSKNTSSKALTLSRGYKSSKVSHNSGSIVAQHVRGTGGNGGGAGATVWSFNISSACPNDGSGRKYNEVLADHLVANLNKDDQGNTYNAFDGLLFDADSDTVSNSADTDNDLAADSGVSTNGEQMWRDGYEELYGMLRDGLPDDNLIVGGTISARGFSSLNGTQMEGFPTNGFFDYPPDYSDLDSKLSTYSYHLHHDEIGPAYSEILNKTPTQLMPGNETPKPTTNAPFRFSFGLALLEDGYYGMWRGTQVPYLDPWWDEYAVDLNTGQAVESNPNDESDIRQHRGWLGYPLGRRTRIYDASLFEASDSLVSNGGFESNLNDWSAKNLTITRATSSGNFIEGTAAMSVSKHISYNKSINSTTVTGPSISLSGSTEYTLAFAIKSSAHREVTISFGGQSQNFYAGPTWTRRVMTLKTASGSKSYRATFQLGQENTNVWIDAVYVFKGNPNVFRRDFENGVVVVNATPSSKTVSLGGTFKRIQGEQDPSVNNGASLSSVTINAYDAAILLRP